MGELDDPMVVAFPLRGEGWMAVTTPASRIPSHGVDLLGQRFAFDFVKVDDRAGVHVHPGSTFVTSTVGGRTDQCYAWDAAIHAPFDGEVVSASDGMPERRWINPFREVARMLWNGLTFRPGKIPATLGNHVILRAGEVYAGFAHLRPGSVAAWNEASRDPAIGSAASSTAVRAEGYRLTPSAASPSRIAARRS